jgi:hypothetical protein
MSEDLIILAYSELPKRRVIKYKAVPHHTCGGARREISYKFYSFTTSSLYGGE